MNGHAIPAVTGNQLIKLLKKDGWEETGRNSHVVKLRKKFPDRTRVTIVQPINAPLADGTLSQILGVKQTAITKAGLKTLIETHGL